MRWSCGHGGDAGWRPAVLQDLDLTWEPAVSTECRQRIIGSRQFWFLFTHGSSDSNFGVAIPCGKAYRSGITEMRASGRKELGQAAPPQDLLLGSWKWRSD
ncbi:hypothetical protein NDU88_004542 [Pleurodeles waltl]|uniref:Uncharacterized protein n=1 Tax=Pleurodeles waltl TaxID=8319 RepID=A0AAV7NNU9_PLEWA|nr:hypothetical protein NDU88_004542 [Pleurodeles waltl]